MFVTRQIVISLVIAAVPPAALVANSDSAQYVGGTVKSIPVNSTGTFSFEDAKEFHFDYKGSTYKLPYDQITTITIEKADVRRVMHILPAVSPVASRRKQTLVVNYADSAGTMGTLKFELPAYRAMEAQETLLAKRSPLSPAVAAAQAAADSNTWWGDSVWKTKRNQAAWDAQAALAAQGAAAQTSQTAAPLQPGQVAAK